MRRSLLIAALLGTTALVPTSAHAGPIIPFFQGIFAAIGASATTAAVAQAIGGSALAGFKVGSLVFGTALGRGLLSLGLSAAAQALARQRIENPLAKQANYVEPVSAMEDVFGLVRKGGPYAIHQFIETPAPAARHCAIMLAAHQIDGIEEWFLDSRVAGVNTGTGQVNTPPYGTDVWLWPHLGAPGQVADARMVSRIPQWTSAHDLAGIAYVHAEFRTVNATRAQQIYGTGNAVGPIVAPAFRGALVYDPRTDSTGWSDNAALVIAWLLTRRGLAVDWDEVAAEADVADQLVANKRGSFQRRWTLNGTVRSTDDLSSILEQITVACDVWWTERPDGTVGFRLGRWQEPTLTLTERDFYEVEVTVGVTDPNAPTEMAALYVEPINWWGEVSLGPFVIDPDAEPNKETVPLYYCDTPNQTARAMKRIIAARRPKYRVAGEVGPIGYDFTQQRFVRVEWGPFAFDAEIVRVQQGASPERVAFEAVSVEESDWAFDPETEEPDAPDRTQPPEADGEAVRLNSVTGTAPGSGQITWTVGTIIGTIAVQNVVSVQYRRVGALTWIALADVTLAGTVTTHTVTVSGLVPGALYEARARYRRTNQRPAQWRNSSAVAAGT
jgi:hypothetical protein